MSTIALVTGASRGLGRNTALHIARKGGDTSYDNLGPSLARRSQAPSSRRIMRFAQERGRAGTAEAVSSFRRTFLS